MITEERALELVCSYGAENYGEAAQSLVPILDEFEAGWLAFFEPRDGSKVLGGETLFIDRDDGSITSYASFMSPREIEEIALNTKREGR